MWSLYHMSPVVGFDDLSQKVALKPCWKDNCTVLIWNTGILEAKITVYVIEMMHRKKLLCNLIFFFLSVFFYKQLVNIKFDVVLDIHLLILSFSIFILIWLNEFLTQPMLVTKRSRVLVLGWNWLVLNVWIVTDIACESHSCVGVGVLSPLAC